MNARPLIVCGVLAVPLWAAAVALDQHPPTEQVSTFDPPVIVSEVTTTAVQAAPPTVASLPPAPAAVVTQTAQRGTQQQVTDTLPPPPKPFVWDGPRPAGATWGIPCNVEQATIVASSMMTAGASYDSIVWMLGIIGRESGCRHWVRNNNPATGDDSFSLCQLNARAGHFGPNGVLSGWDRWRMLDDFTYAADGCAEMWSVCGRGPWRAGNYGCSKPEELT